MNLLQLWSTTPLMQGLGFANANKNEMLMPFFSPMSRKGIQESGELVILFPLVWKDVAGILFSS